MSKDVGGRPTVMTEETLQKLEEAFSWGCTDKEACGHADIAQATLYSYQESNPKFTERKEYLKDNPVRKARQSTLAGMEKDHKHAFDFLKHKRHDEFKEGKQADIKIEGLTLEKALEMDVEELQKIINE